MASGRVPVVGLMNIIVRSDGYIHVRYGRLYDQLDPDHKNNKWVKSTVSRLERDAKKFISQSQQEN